MDPELKKEVLELVDEKIRGLLKEKEDYECLEKIERQTEFEKRWRSMNEKREELEL